MPAGLTEHSESRRTPQLAQPTASTGGTRTTSNDDAPPPNPYVSVPDPSGNVSFTRDRSRAQQHSIDSILGPRPSEVFEQKDRELRIKRQKTAAEEMRRQLMMEVDEDEVESDLSLPAPQPFVFPPQQSRASAAIPPTFAFTCSSPSAAIDAPPTSAAPLCPAIAAPGIKPSPYNSLPKALPSVATPASSSDLRSAAAILAGKKRKPKKGKLKSRWGGNCRYHFDKVHLDLHPKDPLLVGRQSDKGPAIKTLMDYYLSFNAPFFHAVNVEKEQPLLEISRAAQQVRHPPHSLANPKRLRQILSRFALPQTSLVQPLPASVFRTVYMLPSILTDLDQHLIVQELNDTLFDGKIDPQQLYLALMTPSATVGQDYNRLELLGDAFLKYLHSAHVFVSNERTTHEGAIHRARLQGIEADIPSYIMSRPLTSRHFVPPNVQVLEQEKPPPASAKIGGKTIADAVEAILGAAIETGYEQEGLNKAFDLALGAAKALNTLKPVSTCAVLDFHVLRWAWKGGGGALTEGHLTELKGACVSNETLAALAIEPKLDRFLIFDNEQLANNLQLYRERIVKAKEKELEAHSLEQREKRPYWFTLDPPKAVADIVESLFGSLFIESGLDPAAAQTAFDAMIRPFIDEWITPTNIQVDAIGRLLEKARAFARDDVSHTSALIDTRTDPQTGALIPRLTRCSVVAHSCILATCESANRKYAKKLASVAALGFLQANPSFFHHACNCSNVRELAQELANEEHERRRAEGLLSDSDLSDYEDETVPDAGGAAGGGGEVEGMEVDG
ncbi:hypothetical protein JCM11641_005854 [Rhodosporidiobolus odoratus]